MSSLKHLQQPVLMNSLIPSSVDLTPGYPRGALGVPHGATQMSGSNYDLVFVLTGTNLTNFTYNIFGLNFEVLEVQIVHIETHF